MARPFRHKAVIEETNDHFSLFKRCHCKKRNNNFDKTKENNVQIQFNETEETNPTLPKNLKSAKESLLPLK